MNTLKRHAIATGHLGKIQDVDFKDLEETLNQSCQGKTNPCMHMDYCPQHQYVMKCMIDNTKCNVKRFYDRYGKDWEHLGVGV